MFRLQFESSSEQQSIKKYIRNQDTRILLVTKNIVAFHNAKIVKWEYMYFNIFKKYL